MDVERLDQQLASVYRGTPWIVVVDAAAAATPSVAQLREWGVEQILVISAVEGVGQQPDAGVHLTGSHGHTIMEGFRAFSRALSAAPVSNAVNSFDPHGEARILAPAFGAESAFGDRHPYGLRKPEWTALEDKMVIDEHFTSAGITTAPHAIVTVDDAPAAGRALASEFGSVWVADNREGWHGGGEYVRWIRDETDELAAVGWFKRHAGRVRVMPFLDGLPCSIHGYVTDRGVAVFRPVEMLIARLREGAGFRYLGMATTWDPDPEERAAMRAVARRMGVYLAELVGYRGPFSIDGVMSVHGFRPTELNPRMSGGFGIQAATVPELHAGLLTRAVVEGDVRIAPSMLEELIVPAADRDRTLRIGIPVSERRQQDSLPIEITRSSILGADGAGHGSFDIGPAPSGSYALLRPEQEHVPVGVSAGPLAVSAASLAAERWDLEIPSLVPAEPV